MTQTNKKRVATRLILMAAVALVLALVPPVLFRAVLMDVFYLDDQPQEYGALFVQFTRWIHAGGISVLWILNLVFFFVNEKKGDSAEKLQARTGWQNVINFLLIVLGVAAMIGTRYVISADAWIGNYLPDGTKSVLEFLMPYYIFALCGWFFWRFCMKAVPATNCAVCWPLSRRLDNNMKKTVRAR